MSTASPEATAENEPAGPLMPIDLATLLPDTVVGIDLYILRKKGDEPVLYRAKDLEFSESHRRRLVDSGIERLHIEKVDRRDYYLYVESNLPQILDTPRLSTGEKVQAIYKSAAALVNEALAKPTSVELVRRCSRLVNSTVDYLAHRESFHELLRIMPTTYYLNTHSVNVCGLTVALAKMHAIEGEALAQCGLGALLHDIGKVKIHPKILNYRGKLSDEEMAIIKRHPQEGLAILARTGKVPPPVRTMVLEHHEAFDGSGYPMGKVGTEIHLFARIAHIADVFTALTCERPFGEATDTFAALTIMTNEMFHQFDPLLFREFVRLLGK